MRPALVFLPLLLACYSVPTAPSNPSALAIVSGDAQAGVPGYRLGAPIKVRLLDDLGQPVAGDTISFTPSDSSGLVEPNSAPVTDSSGSVTVYWRIGGVLGPQTLAVRALGVPGVRIATVTATARSNYLTTVIGREDGLCGVDAQGSLSCWVPPRLHQSDP
ncbi:MAG: hypothetical protein ACRELE_09590, partial [Gemmatimonadales bacterium]